MVFTPVPEHGGVVLGRDRPGRTLRVSSHPDLGRVVLSLWDGGRCIGTLRLAPEDVPDMVATLTGAAAAAAGTLDQPRPGATTHPATTGQTSGAHLGAQLGAVHLEAAQLATAHLASAHTGSGHTGSGQAGAPQAGAPQVDSPRTGSVSTLG